MKINPFIVNADKGMIATNAEITNSLLILFELALNILNNEKNILINIVKVLTNNMLRFISLDATNNTAINPISPKVNDTKNHFVNLSI